MAKRITCPLCSQWWEIPDKAEVSDEDDMICFSCKLRFGLVNFVEKVDPSFEEDEKGEGFFRY